MREIHTSVTREDFEKFIIAVYDPECFDKLVRGNLELALLLLDALGGVYTFLHFRRITLLNLSQKSISLVAENLSGITLSSLEEAKQKFTERFLNCIRSVLFSEVQAVREIAIAALYRIGDYLTPAECDQKLLPVILQLLRDPSRIRNLLAVDLLRNLAHLFSTPCVDQKIYGEIIALFGSKDIVLVTNAHAAFFSIVGQLSEEFLINTAAPKILATFIKSSSDIKIICLRNLDIVVRRLPLQSTTGPLSDHYFQLLSGKIKPLKLEALRRIGLFLDAFLNRYSKRVVVEQINFLNKLFRVYLNLLQFLDEFQLAEKISVVEQNVRFLDDIFEKFGPDLWPYVRYFFIKLDDCKDLKLVEHTKLLLTAKLVSIAKGLDPKNLVEEMLPIVQLRFVELGRRTPMAVRLATVRILARFLVQIPLRERRAFGDCYISIHKDAPNWRYRYDLTSQFRQLFELLEPNDVAIFIIPMFFAFCKDECALVRKKTASFFHALLGLFQSRNTEHLSLISDHMISFAVIGKCSLRMTYVDLFFNLAEHAPKLLTPEMNEKILVLARDRVENVRIKLAIELSKAAGSEPFDKTRAALLATMRADGSAYVKKLLKIN